MSPSRLPLRPLSTVLWVLGSLPRTTHYPLPLHTSSLDTTSPGNYYFSFPDQSPMILVYRPTVFVVPTLLDFVSVPRLTSPPRIRPVSLLSASVVRKFSCLSLFFESSGPLLSPLWLMSFLRSNFFSLFKVRKIPTVRKIKIYGWLMSIDVL